MEAVYQNVVGRWPYWWVRCWLRTAWHSSTDPVGDSGNVGLFVFFFSEVNVFRVENSD